MPFRCPSSMVPAGGSLPMEWPYNPGGGTPAGCARSPVWPWPPFARRYSGDLAVDFSSSGYLDVSVPRVVLPTPMRSGRGYAYFYAWVRPFGYPRVEGCVLLAGDYRGLPRPSSAPCAKASAVRPWYLGPAPRRGPTFVSSSCSLEYVSSVMNSAHNA